MGKKQNWKQPHNKQKKCAETKKSTQAVDKKPISRETINYNGVDNILQNKEEPQPERQGKKNTGKRKIFSNRFLLPVLVLVCVAALTQPLKLIEEWEIFINNYITTPLKSIIDKMTGKNRKFDIYLSTRYDEAKQPKNRIIHTQNSRFSLES